MYRTFSTQETVSADQLKYPGVGFRSQASTQVVPLSARLAEAVTENRNTRTEHLINPEWKGRDNESVVSRITAWPDHMTRMWETGVQRCREIVKHQENLGEVSGYCLCLHGLGRTFRIPTSDRWKAGGTVNLTTKIGDVRPGPVMKELECSTQKPWTYGSSVRVSPWWQTF